MYYISYTKRKKEAERNEALFDEVRARFDAV